jgi:PTS system nitrogen regulatory IIA component
MLLSERTAATCSSLADYTRPGLIVPEFRERDTVGVVQELSQKLHEQGCVPDVLAFYHAALNHEFLVNSATDCGVAIPHARLNGVTSSCFAFGRSPEPISWSGKRATPVQFVFLIAVPATDAAGFLQLLSALAKLSQQETLLNALRAEPTAPGIFELFKGVKVRTG